MNIPTCVIFGLALYLTLQRLFSALNCYIKQRPDSGGTFFSIVMVVMWAWFYARHENLPGVPPIGEVKVYLPQAGPPTDIIVSEEWPC